MSLDKLVYDQHTQPMLSHINVGYGEDVSIRELAETIGRTLGYRGTISFDVNKPDGTPRKLMDSSRLNALGWTPRVDLEAGLKLAYADFVQRLEHQLHNRSEGLGLPKSSSRIEADQGCAPAS